MSSYTKCKRCGEETSQLMIYSQRTIKEKIIIVMCQECFLKFVVVCVQTGRLSIENLQDYEQGGEIKEMK